MLKNHFKIAWRNLWKNKTYMILNLAGLGFAMACCITTFLNFDYKLRFDEHHKGHTSQVYRVNSVWNMNGYDETWGLSPVALGMALANDTRISPAVPAVVVGYKVFKTASANPAETMRYE